MFSGTFSCASFKNAYTYGFVGQYDFNYNCEHIEGTLLFSDPGYLMSLKFQHMI